MGGYIKQFGQLGSVAHQCGVRQAVFAVNLLLNYISPFGTVPHTRSVRLNRACASSISQGIWSLCNMELHNKKDIKMGSKFI